jgi:hypothetical protein
MSSFACKAGFVSFFLFVIAGIQIASVALPWYYFSVANLQFVNDAPGPVVLNSTRLRYSFDGIRTEIQALGRSATTQYRLFRETAFVQFATAFSTSQGFLIFSIVLSALLAVLQFALMFPRAKDALTFLFGGSTLRGLSTFTAFTIALAAIVAVLSFLQLPSALSFDVPFCPDTSSPCRAFLNSLSVESLTVRNASFSVRSVNVVNFGPDVGWFLALGTLPVPLAAIVILAGNALPVVVKIDDDEEEEEDEKEGGGSL